MTRRGRYRRIEIQVGIFAVLALLVLVLGLLWLRDFRFARRYHVYRASFDDTGGLVPGDIVMVAGFRKGNVRAMRLLESGVEVELAVEQDVVVRSDAVATIGTKGLLGERYVSLDRGTDGLRLPPGSELRGRLEYGMSDIMAGAGELIDSARLVSEDVRKVLQALSSATEDAELARGVRDAAAAAGELRGLLETNRESLHTSIDNFRRASASLANVTAESQDDFLQLARDMRRAAARFDSVLAALDATMQKTDDVATRLLDSRGTFGKLLDDPSLYEDLRDVAARTDSLVRDIRARPRRYFSFSIF